MVRFGKSDYEEIMAIKEGETFQQKVAIVKKNPRHPKRRFLDKAYYCNHHLGEERRASGPDGEGKGTARMGASVRERNRSGWRQQRMAREYPVGHKLDCATGKRHLYGSFSGYGYGVVDWGEEGEGVYDYAPLESAESANDSDDEEKLLQQVESKNPWSGGTQDVFGFIILYTNRESVDVPNFGLWETKDLKTKKGEVEDDGYQTNWSG